MLARKVNSKKSGKSAKRVGHYNSSNTKVGNYNQPNNKVGLYNGASAKGGSSHSQLGVS
jgi:hypothetical protein